MQCLPFFLPVTIVNCVITYLCPPVVIVYATYDLWHVCKNVMKIYPSVSCLQNVGWSPYHQHKSLLSALDAIIIIPGYVWDSVALRTSKQCPGASKVYIHILSKYRQHVRMVEGDYQQGNGWDQWCLDMLGDPSFVNQEIKLR